uniref:Calponin n=1 Tax=Nannospalax galili TaxID=1026970 RepID=A0A8C6S077_NANGA
VSSTQFNKGLSYRLSAEVKNWLLSEYDPQKESELCCWIERLTGQKGSVPKINRSQQNWHQPENLSNFIKAMVSYGMNPVYLFEANDLPKSRNKTHMQVSLLALAGKAKTKGLQSGMDIGVKYSEKQQRNFDDATLKMGANKCTSQSGMMAYGTRRHLYDPKNHILPSMDHCTISLQMGINECASQVGMTAQGPADTSMTRNWAQTSVTVPSCHCRPATARAPTRAARSSVWGGRSMTPSTARRAQRPMLHQG